MPTLKNRQIRIVVWVALVEGLSPAGDETLDILGRILIPEPCSKFPMLEFGIGRPNDQISFLLDLEAEVYIAKHHFINFIEAVNFFKDFTPHHHTGPCNC